VNTALDQVVEVKVLLSTKHARRARVFKKNINDIPKYPRSERAHGVL
jgi:hypothetical protein